MRKTITLHVHRTFLRMSLLTLRDYNVKFSFKALYRGRKPGEHTNRRQVQTSDRLSYRGGLGTSQCFMGL